MKKFFTILCAAMLSFGVSAQTDAGNMYLGASSNLDIQFGDREDMKFDATAGYFVMDNLMVSAQIMYNKTSNDVLALAAALSGTTYEAEGEFGFGAGVRYYMNNIYCSITIYKFCFCKLLL